MRRAGIPVSPRRDRLALLATKWRTVATPEYFRLAVFSLRHYGAHGIAWRVTDHAQNAEKTKLPDGTIVWKETTPEQAVGGGARLRDERSAARRAIPRPRARAHRVATAPSSGSCAT